MNTKQKAERAVNELVIDAVTAIIIAQALLDVIEVIEFYATKENWITPSTGFAVQYDPEPSPVQADRGTKAIAFLKGVSEDEPQ